MKVFKNAQGQNVNVVQHTLNILKSNPTVQIHIGTDSQTKYSNTLYATVIAYRYGNRGVTFIASKQSFPKINDLWSRLWKEAEMSIQIADWLTSQVNVSVQIDMDYNEDKFQKSHILINAAKGWANSLGYQVNVKPHVQVATKAADYLIK